MARFYDTSFNPTYGIRSTLRKHPIKNTYGTVGEDSILAYSFAKKQS